MSLGVLVDANGESRIRNNNIKQLVDEFYNGNPRGLPHRKKTIYRKDK